MTITVGSLSSGYGGLEMALTAWLGAGAVDVRWHAEIDPDASMVLKTHWPKVPNLGSFADEDFWERAERVHLMCGGIPCQPFSAAGRQLGTDDARHLWPFWRRGIELHRPATVVFENVANLTRGKMRSVFDAIIADLLALGYDVRWCLLGACAVGAAHHRHRVFLLACRTRTTPNAAQVAVQTCGQANAAYVPTPVVTDAKGARTSDSGRREGSAHHGGVTLGDMVALLPTTQARDGLTGGDRPSALGGVRESGAKRAISLSGAVSYLPTPSAVSYGSNQGGGAGRTGPVRQASDALARLELLPTINAGAGVGTQRASANAIERGAGPRLDQALELARAELPREFSGWSEVPELWTRGMPLLPSPIAGDSTRGVVRVERAAERGRASSGQLGTEVAYLPTPNARDGSGGRIASGDIAPSSAVQPERWGKYAEAIARHEAVLGRAAPEPTEIGPKGGRRLAAAFSEWLMMLPEGHLTSVLARNPALARAGNGVIPLQAATALRLLFTDLTEG